MRRSALVGTILLTAGLLVGGPAPAQASYTGSCNGHGWLITDVGLRSPGPLFSPPVTANYYFVVRGVCATPWGLFTTEFWGAGVLTGYCENWTGTGVINSNHDHDHRLLGATWTVGVPGSTLGEVAGSFKMAVDPAGGGSCLAGTANGFAMVGGVVLL